MNYRNLIRGLLVGRGVSLPSLAASEETLVPDLRSGQTLAQMVERRFVSLLRAARPPVSPKGKFKPGVVGQIAQSVARFEVAPSLAGAAKQAEGPTPGAILPAK